MFAVHLTKNKILTVPLILKVNEFLPERAYVWGCLTKYQKLRAWGAHKVGRCKALPPRRGL